MELQRRPLGDTQLSVSELSLGTVTFGDVADESAAASILDKYLEAGGNFIDTADVYADGRSEQMLGRLLRGRRDKALIGTKGGMASFSTARRGGGSREHLLAAVEGSLRRLQTDVIDLYQLHVPDPATPIEETLDTLAGLVKEGKIRYYGASNFSAWQLAKALGISTARAVPRFKVLQAQYSLLVRDLDTELVPLCQEERLPIIAWAPLGGGLLSGKYHTSRPPGEGTRLAEAPKSVHPLTPQTQVLIDEVGRIAAATGHTPAQVALRWVLQSPQIACAIVGARSAEQMADNLAIAGWRLEDEHYRSLAKLSRPRLPYPQGLQRMLGCQPQASA
jgi:aryl-alcohol dehydrogenase-like predicted oxidoreductase